MAQEPRQMPQQVSEENIGVTELEQDWRNLPDPRPPVSRWLFFFVGLAIIIACIFSGVWYYYKNIIPEKMYARAENYLMDGDYAGAYRLFEEVYEVKPKRKDVVYNLARCLENMGRFEAAANRFAEQLDKVPYDSKTMLALGKLYLYRLNEPQKGMELIEQGAKKSDTPESWETVVQAAKTLNDREKIISALVKEAKKEKQAEKIAAIAKRLYATEAYEQALLCYNRALDENRQLEAAISGVAMSREKLGLPDSEEHTITPAKGIGKIKIGESKSKVKELLGSPEKKLFPEFAANGEFAGQRAEIWCYGINTPDKLRIIFHDGKVLEIETASLSFKTEEGLGLVSFSDPRFANRLEFSPAKDSKTVIYTLKEGGLSFYAETDKNGNLSVRYRKLRVFKGKQSQTDNEEGLTLLNLREK